MTIDNETILKVAREIWNTEFDVYGPRTRVLNFARRIAALQREIDAGICSSIHNGWIADDSDAWLCAAAIREQRDE